LFGLGLGELTGLKVVPTDLAVTTPHVPVDVLASLVQGGVPHRPTDIAELLALAGLLLGQSRPVATTRQHETPPSSAVLLVLHIALDGRRRRTPDRKSTRLNSSHVSISYAVFCLKKKTPPAH